jgi:hypothetical protein
LRIDVAAVPTGMGNMRLHVYDVTPPSAIRGQRGVGSSVR